MSDIKQYPVIEFISEKIKNAIADAKLEKQAEGVSIIKDGNDIIHIEQKFEGSDNAASIFITDKKQILYSEDLLEPLQEIHEGTESNKVLYDALKASSIVVNGLSIETEFVFQAVKDCFDNLSNSYEFVKTIEKKINDLTMEFKFGDHKFKLIVANQPEEINANAEFDNSINPKIKSTIETDVAKVQQALNKLFKA